MMREDIIRTFSATFHPAQGEIPLTKIRLNVQRSDKGLGTARLRAKNKQLRRFLNRALVIIVYCSKFKRW